MSLVVSYPGMLRCLESGKRGDLKAVTANGFCENQALVPLAQSREPQGTPVSCPPLLDSYITFFSLFIQKAWYQWGKEQRHQSARSQTYRCSCFPAPSSSFRLFHFSSPLSIIIHPHILRHPLLQAIREIRTHWSHKSTKKKAAEVPTTYP